MTRRKLTIEFVRASFEAEKYILLSKKYLSSKTKLKYECPQGHVYNINWSDWQTGNRCFYCGGQAKPSISFIKESFEKEGYVLLDTVYINNKTKLNYICSNGHKHSISWTRWKRGQRCGKCIENNGSWKGGICKTGKALYNTYSHQIDYCEETRRDPNNLDLLQVRCTKCNKFFVPMRNQVWSRIKALNNLNNGENHFYCSDECKHSCSIFAKKTLNNHKKDLFYTDSDLKIWSKEVLIRAHHLCEYCSEPAEHAHHIQPKKLEPFFALDPANGIACCGTCHYKYGHKDECSTGNLANLLCS